MTMNKMSYKTLSSCDLKLNKLNDLFYWDRMYGSLILNHTLFKIRPCGPSHVDMEVRQVNTWKFTPILLSDKYKLP